MKLKGVGFFEQHVEKIVLGVVSAVFLGVVAMQFLYEPNRIKVGNETRVPGEAFVPVREKADMIKGKMEAGVQALNLPEVPRIDLVQDFKQRQSGAVAPSPMIASLGKGSTVVGEQQGPLTPQGTQRIMTMAIPAPKAPVAAGYRNTFAPTEIIAHPELKPLLPPEQPFDKASVTVQAEFDGTAFKASLLGSGRESEGGSPIPVNWWRDNIEVMSIKLERQEQLADGSWGPEQVVAAPPGRGVPDLVKEVKGPQDLFDALGTARAAAGEIQRPDFYQIIAGPEWKPPVEAVKGSDVGKMEAIRKLIEQRVSLLRAQDNIRKQLDEAGAPPAQRRDTGGGGGGRGRGGGGGGGAQPPSDPEREQRARENRLRPIQDRLKKNEEQVAKNEADLKDLGVDTDGNPLPVAAEPQVAAAAMPPLLDNPKVDLWAHDLTVTPGKTYRYRVKVVTNNPMFGRSATLVAEQQELSKSPVVESAPSEWTNPIAVLADKYYFIASATEADAQGPARARAEMFKFFYGYYRPSLVYLEPGDPLSGNVKLPDPDKLPVYDISKLQEVDPNQVPAAPIGQPPREPGPPGRGKMPGEVIIEERGGGQEPAKPALPENAKPWAGPVPVTFDAYLLDVAKVPGEIGGVRTQTFLRGNGGAIVIRPTSEDEKSQVYPLVAASAKDGENQGQPILPVVRPRPEQPPPGPGRGVPPPPPPPGGGGGGGG